MGFFDDVVETVKSVSRTVDTIRDDVASFVTNEVVNPVADVIRDTHTVDVVVVNETGKTIKNVHVKHKYSSNFRSARTWPSLSPGETSNPKLQVKHATGAVTTGKDWWFVCWTQEDGVLVHNRGGIALDSLQFVEESLLTVGGYLSGGTAAVLKLAGILGENVDSYNNHTLSSKASERPVRIVLRPDSILFDSRATDDEVFDVMKISPNHWKGWDSRFEGVYTLGLHNLIVKLYSSDY